MSGGNWPTQSKNTPVAGCQAVIYDSYTLAPCAFAFLVLPPDKANILILIQSKPVFSSDIYLGYVAIFGAESCTADTRFYCYAKYR